MNNIEIDDLVIKVTANIQNRNTTKDCIGTIDGSVSLCDDQSLVASTFRLTHLEVNERKNVGSDFCDLFMYLVPAYGKIRSICMNDCERWKSAFLNSVHGNNCKYMNTYIESIMIFDWMYVCEKFACNEFYELLMLEILYYYSNNCEYVFLFPKSFFCKTENGAIKHSKKYLASATNNEFRSFVLLDRIGFKRIKTTEIYALDTQFFRHNIYQF